MKFNGMEYDLSGEYGIGYTSKREPFYFDKEDFDMISAYIWWIDNNGYVCATTKEHKNVRMHRMVLGCSDRNLVVDHIHHMKNDNRKSQLRIATVQENQRNQKINSANTSGKTGVSFNSKSGKWKAYITIDKKQKSLGSYFTYDEAVQARTNAEKIHFQEFRYRA